MFPIRVRLCKLYLINFPEPFVLQAQVILHVVSWAMAEIQFLHEFVDFFCFAIIFFCFSFCVLYTVFLKLSVVDSAIIFCLPASSAWPIGWVLSRFLMTVFRLIPDSSLMVAPIFCISSLSPCSSNLLITRHGRRKYFSWLSIFVWRKLR